MCQRSCSRAQARAWTPLSQPRDESSPRQARTQGDRIAALFGRPRTPHGGDLGRSRLRFLVAAFGDPGHVFPAISLGRALARRGHAVTIETWEERRAAVEGAGLDFAAAEEYRTFPPPEPETVEGQHAADAARALLPLLERLD